MSRAVAFAAMLLGLSTAGTAQAGSAGLVVQNPDGTVVTECVEFTGATITGYELLQFSSLAFTADDSSHFGAAICSIEGVGCDYPAESCFCQCAGGATCNYWSYWLQSRDGSWTSSHVGASTSRVRDGSVNGWAFGDGSAPPLSISFDEICQ